jgi:signal transduction histidine kinase
MKDDDVASEATAGLGLTSIRERARSMGGNVAITSAPGEGTIVTVRIPLDLVVGSSPGDDSGQHSITAGQRKAAGARLESP